MHGRHLQELLNRRLLPGCQGVMELHHVFQDGRLGEYLTDQRLDGLLGYLHSRVGKLIF